MTTDSPPMYADRYPTDNASPTLPGRHSLPDNPCTHYASLHRRCVDCGRTWAEQSRDADVRRAINARVDERREGRILPRRRADLFDVAASEMTAPRVLLDSLRIGGAA